MKKILLLIFIVLAVSGVNAQWLQTNGPFGGDVNCFAFNGSSLFAGTNDGGIFLSTNNGNSWTPVDNGLTCSIITVLTVSDSVIYAGTNFGIFISPNNGKLWVKTNFVVPFRDPGIISIAVQGALIYATSQTGVYLSTDNGNSWNQLGKSIFSGITPTSLTVNGTSIFVGTDGIGILRSDDEGSTWTHVNSGLPDSLIMSLVTCGSNIYVLTQGAGLARSTDNGNSWVEVNNAYFPTIAANDSEIVVGIIGGVMLSTDYGYTWRNINSSLMGNEDMPVVGVKGPCIVAANGSNINAFPSFYGYNYRLFVSADYGKTWANQDNGLIATAVVSLVIKGSEIFAGTVNGLFLSINNGNSWKAINAGLRDSDINTLAVNGTDIFAGTDSGMYLSDNDGANWTAINHGLTDSGITAFAISGPYLFAGTNSGIFQSSNRGTSWTKISTIPYVVSFGINGTTIFACTLDNGVYLSTNNGNTWAVNSLPSIDGGNVIAIGDTNIFAGTYGDGVYASSDNGNSWKKVSTGFSLVFSLAVNGTNVFAGTDSGVFISYNNGRTWAPFYKGLRYNGIYALAISDTTIFAGTTCKGVWKQSVSGIISSVREAPPPFQSYFTLYPNPANNELTIEVLNSEAPKQISITNDLGQTLIQLNTYKTKTQVNVSSLAAGIYFVKTQLSNGNVQVNKFVKE